MPDASGEVQLADALNALDGVVATRLAPGEERLEVGTVPGSTAAPAPLSEPPSALVDAAIARFGRGPGAVRWSTTVPREVGLGGSSAIVTATIRPCAGCTATRWRPKR